ncbi:Tetratricopeptide-like helical [Penicillium vulpinum]|nr:Tetratricopeptide-like helical [Penicillium vulpinum]KAJ5952626.1 Tetratricopeptide-like helical [Penicillium vulpinum]
MLEELGRALPRFPSDEQKLPVARASAEALVAMYTEIIILCAHSIALFRNNLSMATFQKVWSSFSKEFPQVIVKIRDYSKVVDQTANMISLSRETQSVDTISAMSVLKDFPPKKMNIPCYMIPYGLNNSFFGRQMETDMLNSMLDPDESNKRLKVASIYGTGGVGKTQLALHYVNTSMDLFDAILWIPSETQTQFTQALTNFASKLGISSVGNAEDENQLIQKLRNWLNDSGTILASKNQRVRDYNLPLSFSCKKTYG